MWGCEKTKILILEKYQLNTDINHIWHIKNQIWVESKALSLLKLRLLKMQRKKIASHWPKAALSPFWNTYSLGFSIMFKRRLHILQSHKESCLMKIPKSTDGEANEPLLLTFLPSSLWTSHFSVWGAEFFGTGQSSHRQALGVQVRTAEGAPSCLFLLG